MKKYYIILILVIIAGCASDSVSESKKESALEKKSVAKADNNVVKVQVPKSRKIASQRSKNRNIKNKKPIQSKKQ